MIDKTFFVFHRFYKYSIYIFTFLLFQGCGEPRSEINHCNQRNDDDPQLSLNFGKIKVYQELNFVYPMLKGL